MHTGDGGVRVELAVIGSGPGGQRAAIAAAKLGARVALVEKHDAVGGVWVHTGTIPSKTLRESIVYLTGLHQREVYGRSYRLKRDITVRDLAMRADHVQAREADVVRDQLTRNRVEILHGTAEFVDPHRLLVRGPRGDTQVIADHIVIATGTRPARPESIAFDGRVVVDSDSVLELDHVPESVTVVGAGVIGVEYASMFAALGCRVTLVERRDRMLEFCDDEIVDALQFRLRDLAVSFRLGEEVAAVEVRGERALTTLCSGKQMVSDLVLYSAGRHGVTDALRLDRAGLAADDRGRLVVGPTYRTAVDHIYAVGDVIGFPALASTAVEQGRIAAHDALGVRAPAMGSLVPFGIYTIPEIGFVGATERELTSAAVPYEVGTARYRELARGQIQGDTHGMLKLLVSPSERTLLGVHAIGMGSAELVHLGQVTMALGGTVDTIGEMIFNVPTLAEAYKVAAFDAMNRIRSLRDAREHAVASLGSG
ncbi:MAG TPA: Si-specific NAD(P)(+) transhydrogenase [Acidimicrobiia bacterium]|nr:Si-specific NAD(P)(+) transhydrogenase [Acidimicrobiia bacterium]